ncbi:MAG: tyrosine-type recombinase/integrase [Verrucomicrobiae bacterium]
MTPAKGAALYIAQLETLHQNPSTLRNARRLLERFAQWLEKRDIGDLRDVAMQTLLDYHVALGARRKANGEPNSADYINSQVWHIKAMFRLLHGRGKVLVDPGRNLPALHKPRRLPKNVLTGSQANRLLARPDTKTLWGYRDRVLLELLYSSGLRGLEIVQLTVHDIDWKEKTVRIVQGKGRKDRITPIGRVALNYLREYVERIRPVLLGSYSSRSGRPVITGILDLLFFSRLRTPMTRQYLRCAIARYAKQAGIPARVTTHSLRHACATEMLKGGANVRHVQEMLGHANLATTQVYTHVLPYDLKKVHARTAPSEKRRVLTVPEFEAAAWNDRKNSGHYR